jgi:integration host factor subunit beta
MTRSELIDHLHSRFPALSQDDAKSAVAVILNAVTDTLASANRIEIRGFGTFVLVYQKPRMGRNPLSGERVSVPGKHRPYFKAGKELRERVDL